MVKVIVGWGVMIVTTVAVLLGAIFSATFSEENGAPNASPIFFWFIIFGSSFTGYWVSVRFIIQSRADDPASLNNSTNSECKS